MFWAGKWLLWRARRGEFQGVWLLALLASVQIDNKLLRSYIQSTIIVLPINNHYYCLFVVLRNKLCSTENTFYIVIILQLQFLLLLYNSLFLSVLAAMLTNPQRPFTNNVSGNLNKQQQHNKFKQIDLDDLDVEMLSPQFLQNKTLKKPLSLLKGSLANTNPDGLKYMGSVEMESTPSKDRGTAVIVQKDDRLRREKSVPNVTVIDVSTLNIKPAYHQSVLAEIPYSIVATATNQHSYGATTTNQHSYGATTTNQHSYGIQKDKNTILSAMLRKGLKPSLQIKPEVILPKNDKKMGAAQAKLKSIMKKPTPTNDAMTAKPKSKYDTIKAQAQQVDQQIHQEMDSYGNQSFEKMSVIGQSIIKQSIAAESMAIKQLIRQYSGSFLKESIRQDIRQSLSHSGNKSLKEEIFEEISGSKGKSRQSIEQQVYQQIFQDAELSNSLGKSQNKFKKHIKAEDSFDRSASKSFRMKTSAVKGMRMAQEIGRKERQAMNLINDKKMVDELNKEKNKIKEIKEKVQKLMQKDKKIDISSEANRDLYLKFKIEINKLITSQNFESKVKKLVSFLSVGDEINPRQDVAKLEDSIMKNILVHVQNIQKRTSYVQEVEKVRQQYETKLAQQLKIQQVNLRAQMNQKIADKDLQLKKMIAQLQSRMMARPAYGVPQSRENMFSGRSQQYQIQSDFSIDSDNISWKADLWQLLPQYQKKKLYDRQSAQVTKFLTEIAVSQLQKEMLEQSMDISFVFPDQYNNGDSFQMEKKMTKSGTGVQPERKYDTRYEPVIKKESPVRKESPSSSFLSDLPSLNTKKTSPADISQKRQEQKQKQPRPRIVKQQKLRPQLIKMFASYKEAYLKRKAQVIRNVTRVIYSKDKQTSAHVFASVQAIAILSERDIKKDHKIQMRAYEEQLLGNLLSIYLKTPHRKQTYIQSQMKKQYDRLLVVSQITTSQKFIERVGLDAQDSAPFNVEVLTTQAISKMQGAVCAIQQGLEDVYVRAGEVREEKKVREDLVGRILDILMGQLVGEMPRKKK